MAKQKYFKKSVLISNPQLQESDPVYFKSPKYVKLISSKFNMRNSNFEKNLTGTFKALHELEISPLLNFKKVDWIINTLKITDFDQNGSGDTAAYYMSYDNSIHLRNSFKLNKDYDFFQHEFIHALSSEKNAKLRNKDSIDDIKESLGIDFDATTMDVGYCLFNFVNNIKVGVNAQSFKIKFKNLKNVINENIQLLTPTQYPADIFLPYVNNNHLALYHNSDVEIRPKSKLFNKNKKSVSMIIDRFVERIKEEKSGSVQITDDILFSIKCGSSKKLEDSEVTLTLYSYEEKFNFETDKQKVLKEISKIVGKTINEATLIDSLYLVCNDVDKTNKVIKLINKYESLRTQSELSCETPIKFMSFNEGVTEFLSKLLSSHLQNKPLIMRAYPKGTKYAQLLYLCAGNALFDGFFNGGTFKPLADKLNIDEQIFEDIANRLEVDSNPELASIEELIENDLQLKSYIIDIFSLKMQDEIFNHLQDITSSDEILTSLYFAYIDFGKEFLFGLRKNHIDNVNLETTYEMLTNSFIECYNSSFEAYCKAKNSENNNKEDELSDKDITDISNNTDLLKNLIYEINEINTANYAFIDANVKEINPIDYITKNKKIIAYDLKQNDYVRQKNNMFKAEEMKTIRFENGLHNIEYV